MKRTKAKRIAALALGATIFLGGCSGYATDYERYAEEAELTGEGRYTPGTYTATAYGYGGEITVTMTFSEDGITYVHIAGLRESFGKGGRAIVRLANQLIQSQSADLDAVTGATTSSRAILRAARSCIKQATAEQEDEESPIYADSK